MLYYEVHRVARESGVSNQISLLINLINKQFMVPDKRQHLGFEALDGKGGA